MVVRIYSSASRTLEPTAAPNQNESPLMVPALTALTTIAKAIGLDLQGSIASFDGVYDSKANRKAIFNRGLVPNIPENRRGCKKTKRGRKRVFDADNAVVIPPRASSAPPLDLGTNASRRDVPVHTVAALDKLGWQEATGYGRRALVETTMGRYKALIGPRLRARHDAGRRTGAAVDAIVLNRMLAAGRPNSVRTAPNVS
jgi:hypothetical protein